MTDGYTVRIDGAQGGEAVTHSLCLQDQQDILVGATNPTSSSKGCTYSDQK
jgi:hypothetical protein